MVTFDIRHKGKFVARFSDNDADVAQAHANRIAKSTGLDDVTVEPAKPFELHSRDGLIDAFDTEKEANEVMTRMKRNHKAHVKRGGPEALKRHRKSRGIKRPLGALHADKDPGFFVKDARA